MTGHQPCRVRRTRGKGGGVPDGAIFVGRPFKVERVPGWPRWAGINPGRVVTPDGRVWEWPPGDEPPRRAVIFNHPPDYIDGVAWHHEQQTRLAVHLFVLHTGPMGNFEYDDDTLADLRATLGGRDLACWCPPPPHPCHADHLLALANGA